MIWSFADSKLADEKGAKASCAVEWRNKGSSMEGLLCS